MLRRLIRARFALDLALFVLTTGILAYLSESHEWAFFVAVAAIAVGVYAALKYAETEGFLAWVKKLEMSEFQFTSSLGRYGILKIYNMQDPVERAQRNVDNAEIISSGSTFCLSGTTGASYIDPAVHRHWDVVRSKLEAGCPFKLLLTNPFCESKQLRNRLNGVETAVDPKLNLAVVGKLAQKYPHFEVRFSNELYCSVFYTEHEMMYDPYHVGAANERLENYFVTLRIARQGRDPQGVQYYTQLQRHFDNLWRIAISYEDLITHYSQEIQQAQILKLTSGAVGAG